VLWFGLKQPGDPAPAGLEQEIEMDLRKTVAFHEEINSEYGAKVDPPLRRVVVGAVFKNPLLGKPVGTDLKPLIDISNELGETLTRKALALLGGQQLRAYTKGVIVGTAGDLEHGAALIHPRLGMAMRQTIRRGKVIIPGHAKVGAAGAAIDLMFGPIDEGWDLDAADSIQVSVPDSPRADEIALFLGYASGPRPNARSKGPDQKEVDALVASFR
jgi:hypothetical protein